MLLQHLMFSIVVGPALPLWLNMILVKNTGGTFASLLGFPTFKNAGGTRSRKYMREKPKLRLFQRTLPLGTS